MSFDTEILLPNVENPDKDNSKDYGYKVSYNLKLDGAEKYSTKTVISMILKLDENNQYGYAMTKPIPTGSIKKKVPSWQEFNLLLDLDESIGYLFVLDIFFYYKNATKKQKICNEIYPPIVEKQNILHANERSVYQLIELYLETGKGVPRPTPKVHATLFSKNTRPFFVFRTSN